MQKKFSLNFRLSRINSVHDSSKFHSVQTKPSLFFSLRRIKSETVSEIYNYQAIKCPVKNSWNRKNQNGFFMIQYWIIMTLRSWKTGILNWLQMIYPYSKKAVGWWNFKRLFLTKKVIKTSENVYSSLNAAENCWIIFLEVRPFC